jgi:hypothetical protein
MNNFTLSLLIIGCALTLLFVSYWFGRFVNYILFKLNIKGIDDTDTKQGQKIQYFALGIMFLVVLALVVFGIWSAITPWDVYGKIN